MPVYESDTPAVPKNPADKGTQAPAGSGPLPGPTTMRGTGAATLTVSVPADARIFVNDLPTTSTGTTRSYISARPADGSALYL